MMTPDDFVGDLAFTFKSKLGKDRVLTLTDLKWKINLLSRILFILLNLVNTVGGILGDIGRAFRKMSGTTANKVKYPEEHLSNEKPPSRVEIDWDSGGNGKLSNPLLMLLECDAVQTYPCKEQNVSLSLKEVKAVIFLGCMFHAHFRFCATRCRGWELKSRNIIKLKNELQTIVLNLKQNLKFRVVCHRAISFLEKFIQSDDTEASLFFEKLVLQSLMLHPFWCIRCVYGALDAAKKDKPRVEAVLAIMSLFMKRGASMEIFYINFEFMDRDRTLKLALHIVTLFITSNCGFTEDDLKPKNSDVSTIPNHTESLRKMAFEKGKRFTPMYTKLFKRHHFGYKQALCSDFAANMCNDFVAEEWSVDMMERASWALEIGNRFPMKDEFEILQRNKTKPDLNLTFRNVKSLLALSISGLIKFACRDACAFSLTANEGALFTLHGYMRKPTIEDLVSLRLLEKSNAGMYRALNFPGCRQGHKGICIGERVLLIHSKENTPFQASESQKVG